MSSGMGISAYGTPSAPWEPPDGQPTPTITQPNTGPFDFTRLGIPTGVPNPTRRLRVASRQEGSAVMLKITIDGKLVAEIQFPERGDLRLEADI